jgi:hypothetical protein
MMLTNSSEPLHADAESKAKAALVKAPGVILNVPYEPYYAYRQTLAPFVDRFSSSCGVLRAFIAVQEMLTGASVEIEPPSLPERTRVTAAYESSPPPIRPGNEFLYPERWKNLPTVETNDYFFISYKRSEWTEIEPAVAQIDALGHSIWWDKGIYGGSRWRNVLKQRIEGCQAVLLFASSGSGESAWVRAEIQYARRIGKTIIPIQIDHSTSPWLRKLLDQCQGVQDPRLGSDSLEQVDITLRHLKPPLTKSLLHARRLQRFIAAARFALVRYEPPRGIGTSVSEEL